MNEGPESVSSAESTLSRTAEDILDPPPSYISSTVNNEHQNSAKSKSQPPVTEPQPTASTSHQPSAPPMSPSSSPTTDNELFPFVTTKKRGEKTSLMDWVKTKYGSTMTKNKTTKTTTEGGEEATTQTATTTAQQAKVDVNVDIVTESKKKGKGKGIGKKSKKAKQVEVVIQNENEVAEQDDQDLLVVADVFGFEEKPQQESSETDE